MKKFKIELRTKKESNIFGDKVQELFKFNNQILRKNYKFTISNYTQRVKDTPKFYAGLSKKKLTSFLDLYKILTTFIKEDETKFCTFQFNWKRREITSKSFKIKFEKNEKEKARERKTENKRNLEKKKRKKFLYFQSKKDWDTFELNEVELQLEKKNF
jgi:hypothetical protein